MQNRIDKLVFDKLFEQYDWHPITGCPGRYIFANGIVPITPQQLVSKNVEVREEVFDLAADPVSYCEFEGGGLISYKKQEGYLHTLCNSEGMERKLAMLRQDQSN